MNSEVSRIAELSESGERLIERLRKKAFLPESRKGLLVRYGIAEAAQLLGCSTNRIRMAEEDGRLPPPPSTDSGRRVGYTIEELLTMRAVLGASLARSDGDTPAIIAVQNFKGGVGKSTVTTHLAHYFGVKGYRVLVIDCDSQAATTTLFGFNPHFNITREQTLYPYLSIDPPQTSLLYAVQSTPWPNVDLIPSNLELFDVEYELAAAGADGGSVLASRFRTLKQGLNDLARNYDIVLLDPPPVLGTISLAVMQAANALLVPLPATTPDFCSTVQFLSMMDQVTQQLMRGIHETISKHGLFCSFYTDRGSHYFTTPEARGCSERVFATLQGRLVAELKLAGITGMKAANDYLQETYLPRHNAQFTVTPELEASAFVDAKGIDIANVLCIQEDRIVGADNTVRNKGVTLQIPPSPLRHHYVKTHVRVHHYPDDSLAIFHAPPRSGATTLAEHSKARQARSGPAPATPPLALHSLASRYEKHRTYVVS